MKTPKTTAQILAILTFLAFAPVLSFADMGDILNKFHPYLTFQEEYTDNLDLTRSNRQEDWITTGGLGLRFSTLPATSEVPGQITTPPPPQPQGVDLDYMLGLVFYAKNPDDNYVSHQGRVHAWATLERTLTFRLRDYFVRSQEPRERDYLTGAPSGQLLPGTQRERATYLRNVLEPSVEYRFGPENLFAFNYRNNIYQTKRSGSEDSQENFFNPILTYWFDIRNGLTFEYGYTIADFERSPDFDGHLARGRYSYRFDPRTSFFVEHIYVTRNFDSPGTDYDIHNPSMGIEHAFSPTLSGRLQAGYFWWNPRDGNSESGFSGSAAISKRTARTTYSLTLSAGYLEDFYSSENLGFAKAYRGMASISHALMERFTVGVYGSLDRLEYTTADNRKDWAWRVGGSAAYRIFRWLDGSLEYYHQDLNSNIDLNDYKENRFILRLSATL